LSATSPTTAQSAGSAPAPPQPATLHPGPTPAGPHRSTPDRPSADHVRHDVGPSLHTELHPGLASRRTCPSGPSTATSTKVRDPACRAIRSAVGQHSDDAQLTWLLRPARDIRPRALIHADCQVAADAPNTLIWADSSSDLQAQACRPNRLVSLALRNVDRAT
jgi:hypothetical protein